MESKKLLNYLVKGYCLRSFGRCPTTSRGYPGLTAGRALYSRCGVEKLGVGQQGNALACGMHGLAPQVGGLVADHHAGGPGKFLRVDELRLHGCLDEEVGVYLDFGGDDDLHAAHEIPRGDEDPGVGVGAGSLHRVDADVGALQPEAVGAEIDRRIVGQLPAVLEGEEHVDEQIIGVSCGLVFRLLCACDGGDRGLGVEVQCEGEAAPTGVFQGELPAAGGREHIDDRGWLRDVPNPLAATPSPAASPPVGAVGAGGGVHGAPRFGDDESPHTGCVVGYERVVIEEPVEGLEYLGKALTCCDFLVREAMVVAGAGSLPEPGCTTAWYSSPISPSSLKVRASIATRQEVDGWDS